MGALEGYRTLILALMQFGFGLYLLWTGDKATGMTFVGTAFASIAIRHETTDIAAWRRPPRRKHAPAPQVIAVPADALPVDGAVPPAG